MAKQERTRTRLRNGDRVRVISGKNRGAEGEIIAIMPEKNRVVVKGVNLMKKTRKPTQENPRGGFDEREASVHASNVQLLDPKTGAPTRLGVEFDGERKLRVSRKSGVRLEEGR
jgi:large subunit ribosomal protein L24